MSPPEDPVERRFLVRVGQTLHGKWVLDKLLGVGGMASVYAATHRNGKRGAVKLLHHELSIDANARARFLREGYVANKVDHPGTVSVLDDDTTEEGDCFLVMELLDGETLAARAEARPGMRLSVADVVDFATQTLDVLVAAHEKGIVHRDLKPENLFITKSGQLKVLDFGIARLRDLPGNASATKTGSAMGTPAYMPPEQALGNWAEVDARSDLWAVGATMFAMLTGREVHEADTINKLLLAAMTKHAPLVASIAPDVPPAIGAIVDRALAFQSADRWADARSMKDALVRLEARVEDSISSMPISIGVAPPPSFAGVAPPPSFAAQPTLSASPVATANTLPGAYSSPSTLGSPAAAPSRAGMAIGAVVGLLMAGVVGAVVLTRGHGSDHAESAAPGSTTTVASVPSTAPVASSAIAVPGAAIDVTPAKSADPDPLPTTTASASAADPKPRPASPTKSPAPQPAKPPRKKDPLSNF